MPASMLKRLARQFAAFCGVGVIATAAHYAVLAVLVEAGGVRASLAALIGFTVGGVVSYVLNRRFTFDSARSHAAAVPRFALVAGVAFVLTGILMEVLTTRAGLHWLVAQVITTGIVLVWTFLGNRFWTFRDAA
ncbi:GtrA family protein [Blastochloris sulfoviridis]|uniref:GtrA family protein n=2 Tax=Blastochloris sulfoviridis TaxID=50712 RepID=A0A5M6I302_9HYPH|nr:GtrA family protein [Blastochloris sulfoviridis]